MQSYDFPVCRPEGHRWERLVSYHMNATKHKPSALPMQPIAYIFSGADDLNVD